jgi:uncharacterized membrane protein YfcA
MLELTILAAAALVTSIISAIIGMGGGIMLLAVMFAFLSHADTIPTHGAVQLASNGTRLLAFIRHVHWPTIRRFVWGAVPGAALGGVLLYWLRHGNIESTEPYLKIIIGGYVLLMTFLPRSKSNRTQPQPLNRPTSAMPGQTTFMLFGLLAGSLGLTVGAIGPLIAPLFLRFNFVKEQLIATKAVCQACVHLLKIPAFLLLGSEFVQYDKLWQYIVIMSVMVIPGTLAGKWLLRFVSEGMFVTLYKAALFVAGLKVLAYDGVYSLIGSASAVLE